MKTKTDFPPIARKLNILLAEDDPGDRLIFEEALGDLSISYALTSVNNGQELMEYLDNKKKKVPDVLFLDLNMPRKNGLAALNDIKSNPRLEKLPIIIFTSLIEEHIIRQTFQDAAHYFIIKPKQFSNYKILLHKMLLMISEQRMNFPRKSAFLINEESKTLK